MKIDLILKASGELGHFKRLELPRIPIIGEKVQVINSDGVAFVYDVFDVLFYENKDVDVFVTLECSAIDFFKKKKQ